MPLSASTTAPSLFHKQPAGPTLPRSWHAGLARTAIGIAVGAVVGLSFWKLPFFRTHDTLDTTLFFALLIPVRVLEWLALLRLFYTPLTLRGRSLVWTLTVCIAASFLLDFLAMLCAVILPGGAWVC